MKKILALGLSAALTLSLSVTSLAVFDPNAPAPEGDGPHIMLTSSDSEPVINLLSNAYGATIVLDGETVDITGIPAAPAGYVPMRLLSEANGGSAEWYPEENSAVFAFDEASILVDFNANTVEVARELQEDVKPYLDPAGYTYLPVSLLDTLETVTVTDDGECYTITTSASDPDKKVVLSIMEAVELGARMKSTPAEMEEYMGIHQENFTKIIGYFPMMINADTIVIGEVAEGKMDAAKEDLEARKQTTIQSFEQYLPDPYEMAQNGQIVVAPDGTHIMLIISGDNAKAIEMFNEAYPAEA